MCFRRSLFWNVVPHWCPTFLDVVTKCLTSITQWHGVTQRPEVYCCKSLKTWNVLCRIIPNNCRYGGGVVHSANYSATLTELCNTSVETCISVRYQIISAIWQRCLPVHYHYIRTLFEQVWNVPMPWFMTLTFVSHNSYPSPPRWCTDNPGLCSVPNMELLMDFGQITMQIPYRYITRIYRLNFVDFIHNHKQWCVELTGSCKFLWDTTVLSYLYLLMIHAWLAVTVLVEFIPLCYKYNTKILMNISMREK